jgi:hypothetical protein
MDPLCPHCKRKVTADTDHRLCLFALFESNTIKSVAEWEAMCIPPKPKTIVKGRIRVRLTGVE